MSNLASINSVKKDNTLKVIRDYIFILDWCKADIDKLLKHTSSEDLIKLLNEAVEKYDDFMELDGDNSKINRWLGYVQGVLITVGYLTVQGERDFTREYFTAHRDLLISNKEK